MRRARDVASAAFSVLFGGMWLFAAAAKVAGPVAAYEFLTRALPAGPVAKSAFVLGVSIETLLGAAMALRAVSAVRGFVASLAVLAVSAGLLVHVRSHPGAPTSCGCFGDRLATTIDGELAIDAAMAAVLVALIGWNVLVRSDRASQDESFA